MSTCRVRPSVVFVVPVSYVLVPAVSPCLSRLLSSCLMYCPVSVSFGFIMLPCLLCLTSVCCIWCLHLFQTLSLSVVSAFSFVPSVLLSVCLSSRYCHVRQYRWDWLTKTMTSIETTLFYFFFQYLHSSLICYTYFSPAEACSFKKKNTRKNHTSFLATVGMNMRGLRN